MSPQARAALVTPLVVALCWVGRPMAPQGGPVPGGCLIVDDTATTLVLERAPPSVRRLLGALAEAEVRRLDVLVVAPDGLRTAEAGVAVLDAVAVEAVVRRPPVPPDVCRRYGAAS